MLFVRVPGGCDVQRGQRQLVRTLLGEDPERLTNDRVVADFLCVFILKHENSWFAGLGFLRTPRNCRRWHRRSGVPGLLFLPQALNFIA